MAPKASLLAALSVGTIAAFSISLSQAAQPCPFAKYKYRDVRKPTLVEQIQANSRPLIAVAAVVPGLALAIGLYRGGRSYQR